MSKSLFGGGGNDAKHEPYEEMKDTPWIKQARNIAQRGGQGILDNYNNVNIFDDATRKSIDARNNEIYKRAFDNMERQYMNTMNKYNAANYNRFGTLSATAPYYVTDQYQRDFQRQMNDLAYNQALNYDNLMDKELQRRYDTLNMFNTMYGYGAVPYQQDVANWNTRNTNKDLAYYGEVQNKARNNNGLLASLIPAISMFGSNIGANNNNSNTSGSTSSSAYSQLGTNGSANSIMQALINATGGIQ